MSLVNANDIYLHLTSDSVKNKLVNSEMKKKIIIIWSKWDLGTKRLIVVPCCNFYYICTLFSYVSSVIADFICI